MPIKLISGLPGAAKTLRMVHALYGLVERQEKMPTAQRRPIYVCGVEGLAVSTNGAYEIVEDPSQWQSFKDGAVIFVDEAWKWFGHLQNPEKRTTPKHVLDLAEHRHRGMDFVWTTQEPRQIFPFARSLIGEHEHLVRKFGAQMSTVYKWGELREDVKGAGARLIALTEQWVFPKPIYSLYKSASSHSIKLSIPKQAWIAVLGIPVIIFLIYGSTRVLSKPDKLSEEPALLSSPLDAPAAMAKKERGAEKLPLTQQEYVASFVPRVGAMPWSAPAFDDRKPQSEPVIACMSSLDSCTCLTEQGTRYHLEETMCRHMARHGPAYNPYKRPAGSSQGNGNSQPAEVQTRSGV